MELTQDMQEELILEHIIYHTSGIQMALDGFIQPEYKFHSVRSLLELGVIDELSLIDYYDSVLERKVTRVANFKR
jgi:hypothetical protein